MDNEKNWHSLTATKMKRNLSLPDVLEGAKFQLYDFVDDDDDAFKQKDEDELSEKENSLKFFEGVNRKVMKSNNCCMENILFYF